MCAFTYVYKLSIVQMLSLMKDEWIFSNLNYIKIKIHNQLTKHLDLYFHMFR